MMKVITDHEVNEFLLGRSHNLYDIMGSHLLTNKDGMVEATQFTVYAPNAKEVRLVSDFNGYEGWKHVLTKIHHMGFFRIEIPGNYEWSTYKFEIHTTNGQVLYKADPFAFYAEIQVF